MRNNWRSWGTAEAAAWRPRSLARCCKNSVFTELRKQMDAERLHFWRTNKMQEVDFILEETKGTPGIIIPLEAKLQFRMKDLTSLKYFVEKYGIDKTYVCTLEKTGKILTTGWK